MFKRALTQNTDPDDTELLYECEAANLSPLTL